MAVIDHIDGPNRRIYLHLDTVGASLHPIEIYRDVRALRRTDESLRKFNLFMSGHGYEAKGGGKFTERYFKLLQGTRIIPYDSSHVLTITGTLITDDGLEGVDCFDRSTLTATTVVDINYVPPQVEVITISGGSGLSSAQDTLLTAIAAKTAQMVFTKANELDVNVQSMNDATLLGNGTTLDKWRG